MFDITGLSVFAFLLLKLGLWALVLYLGYRLMRTFSASKLAAYGLLVAAVAYFTFAEGPYRPKTVTAPPADSTSVDRAVPEFRPESRKPTWEEIQRQNAEENEKSRQEFQRLPAAGQ